MTLQDLIEHHTDKKEEDIAELIKNQQFSMIPSYCPTRWWGNYKLISRIVKHYDVLISFFKDSEYKDQSIADELSAPFTRQYFEFLSIFLNKTLKYINLVQGDKSFLVDTYQHMKNLLVELSAYILRDNTITSEQRWDIEYSFDNEELFYSKEGTYE